MSNTSSFILISYHLIVVKLTSLDQMYHKRKKNSRKVPGKAIVKKCLSGLFSSEIIKIPILFKIRRWASASSPSRTRACERGGRRSLPDLEASEKISQWDVAFPGKEKASRKPEPEKSAKSRSCSWQENENEIFFFKNRWLKVSRVELVTNLAILSIWLWSSLSAPLLN